MSLRLSCCLSRAQSAARLIFLRFALAMLAMLAALAAPATGGDDSAEAPSFPSLAVVQAEAAEHFSRLPHWRQGDLITRQDVEPLLVRLQQLGWKEARRPELTELLVPDGEPWVAALRTREGAGFMRKVSSEPLVYDRLDRLSKMRGGAALVRDLVRLPDGARYAREKRGAGTPGMVEFLPKGQSGKAPQPVDYDKPTGRIYTVADLTAQLVKMHQSDSARLDKAP